MICHTRQSRRDSDAGAKSDSSLSRGTHPSGGTNWSESSPVVEGRAWGLVHNACEIRVAGYFFSHVLLTMTGSAIMAWSRGNGDGHLQKAEARKLRLLV